MHIDECSYVPDLTNGKLTFGLSGLRFKSICLFLDMRGSTAILEKHKSNVVINIHKAFFITIVKIVNQYNGQVRSFNGDGILVFFPNDDCVSIENFIKSAMIIKYMIIADKDSLKNKVLTKYQTDIDIGIGLDIGTITAAKVGLSGFTNQDLIWIGSNVNRSVKIANSLKLPNNIGTTKRLYDRLTNLVKYAESNNMLQNSTYIYNETE